MANQCSPLGGYARSVTVQDIWVKNALRFGAVPTVTSFPNPALVRTFIATLDCERLLTRTRMPSNGSTCGHAHRYPFAVSPPPDKDLNSPTSYVLDRGVSQASHSQAEIDKVWKRKRGEKRRMRHMSDDDLGEGVRTSQRNDNECNLIIVPLNASEIELGWARASTWCWKLYVSRTATKR